MEQQNKLIKVDQKDEPQGPLFVLNDSNAVLDPKLVAGIVVRRPGNTSFRIVYKERSKGPDPTSDKNQASLFAGFVNQERPLIFRDSNDAQDGALGVWSAKKNELQLNHEVRFKDGVLTLGTAPADGVPASEGNALTCEDHDVEEPIFRVHGVGKFTSIVAHDAHYDSGATHSDRRIKTEIRPLDDGLSIVGRMKPVRFLDRQKELRVGFIAQDLEDPSVIPEAVVKASEDGIRSVRYGEITAVLTSAIQALARQVSSLDARLTRIEKRLLIQ